jgi:hypothetical protein
MLGWSCASLVFFIRRGGAEAADELADSSVVDGDVLSLEDVLCFAWGDWLGDTICQTKSGRPSGMSVWRVWDCNARKMVAH